jgi:hypothetical protein
MFGERISSTLASADQTYGLMGLGFIVYCMWHYRRIFILSSVGLTPVSSSIVQLVPGY